MDFSVSMYDLNVVIDVAFCKPFSSCSWNSIFR